jgi:hypothetical protein
LSAFTTGKPQEPAPMTHTLGSVLAIAFSSVPADLDGFTLSALVAICERPAACVSIM